MEVDKRDNVSVWINLGFAMNTMWNGNKDEKWKNVDAKQLLFTQTATDGYTPDGGCQEK